MTSDVIIELNGVSKSYSAGEQNVVALSAVNLHLRRKDFAVVMGPSGGGKTTLLNCLGGLDRPDRGEIIVNGASLSQLNDSRLTELRRNEIGFVFQFFNLLPTLTLWENIELPLLLSHTASGGQQRIAELLDYVGLKDRARSFPAELSGGQMQRVAIARALVAQPSILLADEPTGNLDSENGERIMELMKRASSDYGATVILATHNPQMTPYGNRSFEIRDGVLKENN
ncbi:MAG: ABC transporter ATP-binding protein [Candidatus Nitrohelix vancouverensis]|uniref:ABC transporter ATP-binding protein n=1 Tax=Candidatus Nitrohelix vancouverensis TaxID=2705534 RepID=A0A7T0C1K4_9BACT|nr:MAG: ABC transporter ATP-binding protein [Candidatus Nitrohelix vancouverensis]